VDLIEGVRYGVSYLAVLIGFYSLSLDLEVAVIDELAPLFSLAGVSLVN
jgi:hypothetical protein